MARTQANESPTVVAAKVRDYLAAAPPPTRKALTQIRDIVRSVAPTAAAAFSYGIPGFRLHDRPLVWYAGWNKHVSLYPMTDAIRRANAAALDGYTMAKGTVRFPLSEPLPVALIKRLVKARVAAVRADAKERR
jgi:uncharacterized protein YdhG (YjbR/CyaY superfamily)